MPRGGTRTHDCDRYRPIGELCNTGAVWVGWRGRHKDNCKHMITHMMNMTNTSRYTRRGSSLVITREELLKHIGTLPIRAESTRATVIVIVAQHVFV